MNMNQKGFANIVLVVVIVILVGAVGYFAFVKKSKPVVQQPTPTPATSQTKTPVSPAPTQTSNPATANWKIYTNNQYGYEVKYPSDKYNTDLGNNRSTAENFMLFDKSQTVDSFEGGVNFQVRVSANLQHLNVSDYYQQNFAQNTTKQNSTLNGYQAVKMQGTEGLIIPSYLITTNSYVYVITPLPGDPVAGTILSTFKLK